MMESDTYQRVHRGDEMTKALVDYRRRLAGVRNDAESAGRA